MNLEDAETGEELLVDTSDPETRKAFATLSRKKRNERERYFKKIDLDTIALSTEKNYLDPLMRFFRMRERLK